MKTHLNVLVTRKPTGYYWCVPGPDHRSTIGRSADLGSAVRDAANQATTLYAATLGTVDFQLRGL